MGWRIDILHMSMVCSTNLLVIIIKATDNATAVYLLWGTAGAAGAAGDGVQSFLSAARRTDSGFAGRGGENATWDGFSSPLWGCHPPVINCNQIIIWECEATVGIGDGVCCFTVTVYRVNFRLELSSYSSVFCQPMASSVTNCCRITWHLTDDITRILPHLRLTTKSLTRLQFIPCVFNDSALHSN